MSLFSFDDEKLQIFSIIAPFIFDWRNQEQILNAFSLSATLEKAKNTIQAILKNKAME